MLSFLRYESCSPNGQRPSIRFRHGSGATAQFVWVMRGLPEGSITPPVSLWLSWTVESTRTIPISKGGFLSTRISLAVLVRTSADMAHMAPALSLQPKAMGWGYRVCAVQGSLRSRRSLETAKSLTLLRTTGRYDM